MLNEKNFDLFVPHPVGDDVSKIGEYQFAGALNLAASSQKSILRQEAQCPPVN